MRICFINNRQTREKEKQAKIQRAREKKKDV